MCQITAAESGQIVLQKQRSTRNPCLANPQFGLIGRTTVFGRHVSGLDRHDLIVEGGLLS